LAPVSGS
jgi:hypothetical protein